MNEVLMYWHEDMFCLAFRAEEFAASHIDQAPQQTQASINARQLWALLAGQGHKVILVESVERLLEVSVRDAFSRPGSARGVGPERHHLDGRCP